MLEPWVWNTSLVIGSIFAFITMVFLFAKLGLDGLDAVLLISLVMFMGGLIWFITIPLAIFVASAYGLSRLFK